jgi:hypothetical protein
MPIRNSLNPDDHQDEQDRLMTHTLFMAQQAATARLSVVEAQLTEDDETGPDSTTPAYENLFVPENSRLGHRRNRSSQIIDGFVLNNSTPPTGGVRPLSMILGDDLNRLSLARSVRYSHLLGLDDRRLSILQSDELLRHWTDQSDPLADENSHSEASEDDDPYLFKGTPSELTEAYKADDGPPNTAAWSSKKVRRDPMFKREDVAIQVLSRPAKGVVEAIRQEAEAQRGKSPTTVTKPGISGRMPAYQSLPPIAEERHSVRNSYVHLPDEVRERSLGDEPSVDTGDSDPSIELFKSLRVSVEDETHVVLPAALRRYGITAGFDDYGLWVVYENQERLVQKHEKPLLLFKQLDGEGKKPMFMLRKWTRKPTAEELDQANNPRSSDPFLSDDDSKGRLWVPQATPDGKLFYRNTRTGETTAPRKIKPFF